MPRPKPDDYFCPDCNWSGDRDSLTKYSDSSEFWGETVHQHTVDTTTCPACRGSNLEDLADADRDSALKRETDEFDTEEESE